MAANAEIGGWASAIIAALSLGAGAFLLKSLGRPLKSTVEWFYLAGVAGVALWAAYPYMYDGLIGAGDSYHYTLQVADFVTQIRKGIFPVLVGQSEYAFNGNIHTIRTAPYFTHFAGALDLIAFHHCSFFVLKNLTVLLSTWGAAFAAYATVRVLAPDKRLAALLLSFCYVTSPGIMAPLVSHDMYATFMTVPWLPFFWLGVVQSLQQLNDEKPLLLCVGSLALIWYAHPPIAAWLSPVLFGAQGLRLLLVGGAPGNLWRPFAGLALLLLMIGYLVYSVHSLNLGYTFGDTQAVRADILLNGRAVWAKALLPLSVHSDTGHLQLGYTLWACWLACAFRINRTGWPGLFLAAASSTLLLFLLPVPWITAQLWSLVPGRLIDVTNIWPAQRFYPILAAGTLGWIALVLGRHPHRRGLPYTLLCCFLAVGCCWSASELTKLHRQSKKMRITPEESLASLRPENLVLTRSSYLLFNGKPGYYSDGWVDPEFESRLLDSDLDVVSTNTAAILVSRARELAAAPKVIVGARAPLTFDRTKNWLLVFNFGNTTAQGELALQGAVRRVYLLPQSGGKLAFGSSSDSAHTLLIRASPESMREIEFSTTLPAVTFQAVTFETTRLPVYLKSLTPYSAQIHATVPGYLETPQVFVPGYVAIVNGQEATPRRSLEGLLAVPVPTGDSSVVISYVGPPGLKALWYAALFGFLSLPLLARLSRPAPNENEIKAETIRRYNFLTFVRQLPRRRLAFILLMILALFTGSIFVRQYLAIPPQESFGSMRLTINLPRWTTRKAEPLVVTGRTGAADCLYVIYEDAQHIRLGFDHWSTGGPISEPIPAHRGSAHIIEITTGGLYPRQLAVFSRFAPYWENPQSALFEVRYDGRVIWHGMASYYPAAPNEVEIGSNQVGSSTSGPIFTGQVLKSERFIPEFLR